MKLAVLINATNISRFIARGVVAYRFDAQVISRIPIGESVPEHEERDVKEYYTVVGTTVEAQSEPLPGVEATIQVRIVIFIKSFVD